MADIDLHRVHNLGFEAAREAADRMAADLARKFDLRGDWEGNVLRFQRPGLNGSLIVSDRDLRLSLSLGFLLKAMKASIERAVEQELDRLCAGPGEAARPAGDACAKPRKAAPRPKKGG